jgi:hypothetical protein
MLCATPELYGIPLPHSTSAMFSTAANTSAGAGSGAQGGSSEPNRLEGTFSVKMSPDTQIQSFTLFPRFPVELRNMVWDLAACDPRIVEIGGYQTTNKRMRKKEFRFTSKTLVPSILHVSSESRSCGMKHYETLSFGERFTGTFINWAVDFVIFSNGPRRNTWNLVLSSVFISKDVKKKITQKCRHLILGHGDRCNDLGRDFQKLQHVVKVFKVLEPHLKPEHDSQRLGDLSLSPVSEKNLNKWDLANLRLDKSILHKLKARNPEIQHVETLNLVRGNKMPLTRYQKADLKRLEAKKKLDLLLSVPQKPTNINFKTYRVPDLRRIAQSCGLCDRGLKKDLVERLEAHHEIQFAKDMEDYEKAMREHTVSLLQPTSAEKETLRH